MAFHFARLKRLVQATHAEVRKMVEEHKNEGLSAAQLHEKLGEAFSAFASKCSQQDFFKRYWRVLGDDLQTQLAFLETLFEDFLLFSGLVPDAERGADSGSAGMAAVLKTLMAQIRRPAPAGEGGAGRLELLQNFFWGFAFQSLQKKAQLLELLELLLMLAPGSLAGRTILHVVARSEVQSGEEFFLQSWLEKTALSVCLFSREPVEKSLLPGRSPLKFYARLKSMLKHLDRNFNLLLWDAKDKGDARERNKARQRRKKQLNVLSLDKFLKADSGAARGPSGSESECESGKSARSEGEFRVSMRRPGEAFGGEGAPGPGAEQWAPRNEFDTVQHIREVIEQNHALEDVLKDLKVRELVQGIKALGAGLRWRRVDWDFCRGADAAEAPSPARGAKQSKRKRPKRFPNVLNRKVLRFFLFREDPGNSLSKKQKVRALNLLFEFCSFSKDRATFQGAAPRRSGGLSSAEKSESSSAGGGAEQHRAAREDFGLADGVFFDLHAKARDSEGRVRKAFQKLLKFLFKALVEVVMDEDSVPIAEMLQYRRVFAIAVRERHRLSYLVGYLANQSVDAFRRLRKHLRLPKDWLRFFSLGGAADKLLKFIKPLKSKPDKFKVENSLRVHFKFYSTLSWLFGSERQDLLVFFVDKLSLFWNQSHFPKLSATFCEEGRLRVPAFARKLGEVLGEYEAAFGAEEDSIAALGLGTSTDVRRSLEAFFARKAKQRGLARVRDECFKVKIERMALFLRKLEGIVLLRNLAELLATKVRLDDRAAFGAVAEVLGAAPQDARAPRVRETVRLFFLDVLDSRHGILTRFHASLEPLFPEMSEVQVTALSLVDEASLPRAQQLAAALSDAQKTANELFKEVSGASDFPLFAAFVLNRKVFRALDSESPVAGQTNLDESIAKAIGKFKKQHRLQHKFLKKLHLRLAEGSALRLGGGGALSLRQQILALNVLTWVVSSGEAHPLHGLLLDLVEQNNESRKFFFNVREAQGQAVVTNKYVPHEPSRPALRILASEADSRLWHLLLHGFFVAVLDLGLVNAPFLLKPLEEATGQRHDSPAYFVEHFRADCEALARQSPGADFDWALQVAFLRFAPARPEVGVLPQPATSPADAARFAEEFGRHWRVLCESPGQLRESCRRVFRALSAKKVSVAGKTMLLLERRLPGEEARRLVEPFLFSSLRNTKLYGHADLLAKLQADAPQGCEHLRFILRNLVG